MKQSLKPRQIQNIHLNHGLMTNAKTPSKIAKKPKTISINIPHRRILAIFVSSGRKPEEQ